MFETAKDQLISTFVKCYVSIHTTTGGGQLRTRKTNFHDFRAYGAPEFMGKKEPIIIMQWIVDVESSFLMIFFTVRENARFTACLQHEGARDWRVKVVHALISKDIESMT